MASFIPEHMQLIEPSGTGLPSNVPWSRAAGGCEVGQCRSRTCLSIKFPGQGRYRGEEVTVITGPRLGDESVL